MTNRKSILFLLLGIVLLSAANYLVRFRAEPVKAGRSVTLVAPEDAAVEIRIERRGAPPTVVTRGVGWRLTAPYPGAVDEKVVLRLLDALQMIPADDAILDSELLKLGRTRADFSLEDPVIRVSVSMEDGKCAVVSFGGPTPAGDGVYAAEESVAAVYVMPLPVLAAVDVSSDGFRRRTLFPFGPESVLSFEIKRAAGAILAFSRTGDGWRMNDGNVSSSKVRAFLTGLTGASAIDFVWPVGASNETERASSSQLAGYGLDPESAVTVTLKGYDGVDRQVSFGKESEGGAVYALVHDGGAVVTVPIALRDLAAQDAVMFTDSRLFPVEDRSVEFCALQEGDARYALAKDKNGLWRLESPVVAPADQEAAKALVTRVLSLSPADVVADGVSVSVSTDAVPISVSRQRLLDGRSFESLRSCEVVRIDPAQVKRIVRTTGGKEIPPTAVVYGRDRRAWNVERSETDAVADVRGIERVLSALNPLVAIRVEKLKVQASDLDAYGLDTPFLTVAVDRDSEEAVRRNIIIGKPTAGGRFATVGSADAVFVLSDETVANLSAEIVGK